jgi:CheY-like chemotaxis protein
MNILILDDSKTMQKILKHSVTELYTNGDLKTLRITLGDKFSELDNIYTVGNTSDALDILHSEKVDILIQDTNRVGSEDDGENSSIDLINNIRNNRQLKDIKIIINSLNEYRMESYLTKEIDGYYLKVNSFNKSGLSSPKILEEAIMDAYLTGENKKLVLETNRLAAQLHASYDKLYRARRKGKTKEITAILKEKIDEKLGNK